MAWARSVRVQLIRPTRRPAPARSAFAGFRFPSEVIVLAVRWYLRFGLSYRDVEELLAERGIDVDHVTVHRWVQRFTPLLADAAWFGRHRVGDRWHVDETYVKVAGRWVYLYRAVDQFGQVHRRVRLCPAGRRGGASVLPARQGRHRCDTVGGHHRPGTQLSSGPGRDVAGGVAPRRAVRE
jgi:DDE domain